MADIVLSISVPIYGKVSIAQLKAQNLRDGISFNVGLPPAVSGQATIHISNDNYFHVGFQLKIFGSKKSADLAIFRVP